MHIIKRGGYLLMEAMLASVVISAAILLKTEIELRYKKVDEIRLLASNITQIPYGIDKRVLLDGHTLSLSSNSFIGAQDTIENMLNESLIGVGSSACAGGWTPVDSANESLNLISCNLFNYAKMPFDLEMDGEYSLTPNGTISSYSVILYHETSEKFKKHSDIYSKLVNYSRVLGSPQITGSHRFSLVDRGTDAELTPLECFNVGENCGFKAEYTTSNVGLGEDVYLRVNGTNFMRGDIRFPESGSTQMSCRKVDHSGNHRVVDCGIDFADNPSGENDLDFISKGSYSEEFTLSNSSIKNGSSLLEAKCKSVTSSGSATTIPCGMTLLKKSSSELISRAALHEISSGGSIYTHNGSRRTFEVDASSGNVQASGNMNLSGKATIRNGAEIYNGLTSRTGNISLHHGNGAGGSKGLNINNNEIVFTGDIPMLDNPNLFPKQTSGNYHQVQNELVTKGYLHSFNQIIDIRTNANSGTTHRLYVCPNGQYANAIGFPAESSLVQSQSQIDRICPFEQGKRLPEIKVNLHLGFPQPNQISGRATTEYYVGCRWEGDYAQAWFMNVNRGNGTYLPRFYLVSPRTHTGAVANIEVAMRFTVIQYCLQGGLKSR